MTEKDEDRTALEETPAHPAGEPGPAEESPPPATGGALAVLGELADRFDKVEGQLSEFHRRSAHRESLIDRLHEENQRLRGGIGRVGLEPVYVDETGRPVVLKSAVGEDTTPSVVYFESPENVVVGRQAKDSALLAPHLVVELIKRQMGQGAQYAFHGQDHTDPHRARHYIVHLLTANTPLPADTGPETFRTVKDDQREVSLEVWEQAGSVASEEVEHNTHIGEGVLSELPARPAGAPFQVVFHMTETGLLKVHGHDADSGREVRFEIQIGGLDEAEGRRATSAVARYEVNG